MASNELLVSIKDFIATATINRPNSMNSLTIDLRHQLSVTLLELAENSSVRVIILTGSGKKAFSAGLDLQELSENEDALRIIYEESNYLDPVKTMKKISKPIICAVNGMAITGGFELAINCDIAIGSTNAAFADTHSLVGVLPAWGLSQKLSEIVGVSRAKELAFSGRFIYSEEALSWGIVNSVQDPNNLINYVKDLAIKIAAKEPRFIKEYKLLIDQGVELRNKKSLVLEKLHSRAWNSQLKLYLLKKNVQEMLSDKKN